MADLYATDTWNGLPHYTCLGCGYDSMLLTRITDHCASCPAVAALQEAPSQAEASLSSPPDSAPPVPVPNGSLADEEA